MKTRTIALCLLSIAPALASMAPSAAANNTVCFEVGGVSFGEVTCTNLPDLPSPGGSRPSASATIYFQRTLVTCQYWWSTSVSAPSGTWDWTLGEASPVADQRGAVMDSGPVSASYSGNNVIQLIIPKGATVTVVAEIRESEGAREAIATAVFVC